MKSFFTSLAREVVALIRYSSDSRKESFSTRAGRIGENRILAARLMREGILMFMLQSVPRKSFLLPTLLIANPAHPARCQRYIANLASASGEMCSSSAREPGMP